MILQLILLEADQWGPGAILKPRGQNFGFYDHSPPPIRVLGLSAQDRAIKLRESSQELQPPYETGVTLQHPQGTHLRPLELHGHKFATSRILLLPK